MTGAFLRFPLKLNKKSPFLQLTIHSISDLHFKAVKHKCLAPTAYINWVPAFWQYNFDI